MTTLASRPMTAPARALTPAPRPPGRADRRDAAVRTGAGVGDSTVTVESASGTATYQVVSDTQIVRDGAAAQLSDLEAGDPVLVHVYPASSDSDRMVVERIFAGTLPSSPGLGPDDDDDDGGEGATGQPSTAL